MILGLVVRDLDSPDLEEARTSQLFTARLSDGARTTENHCGSQVCGQLSDRRAEPTALMLGRQSSASQTWMGKRAVRAAHYNADPDSTVRGGGWGDWDLAFLASSLLLLLRVWTVLRAPGSNPRSPASHTQKPGAQPIRFKPREVLPSRAAVAPCSVTPPARGPWDSRGHPPR